MGNSGMGYFHITACLFFLFFIPYWLAFTLGKVVKVLVGITLVSNKTKKEMQIKIAHFIFSSGR